MKKIDCNLIIEPLSLLIKRCLVDVEPFACALLADAEKRESNAAAKWALGIIRENNEVARKNNYLACQDCGLAVLFVEIGNGIIIEGDLENALNEGVAAGYADARKSVAHPLTRQNTKTNTPAVINYRFVVGDSLKIKYMAKGAGSENMSAVYMLTPSKGRQGIIDAVCDCVKKAGANPCPPIVIGVGVGGTMDKCAVLSKHALLRKTGEPSCDEAAASLEREILQAVNGLKIGAQGFSGDTTALAVHCELFPTHIGMLPVAVNIQCHSVRHGELEF